VTVAARAVRAEWVKFCSLPSNPVTVTVAAAVIIGLAAMLLSAQAGDGAVPAPTPTELLAGVSWAQFVLAVLAAVMICSEWASGASKITFLAVPTRWPVLAGKVAVVGVVGLVVGAAGGAAAFALASASGTDLGAEPALTVRLVAGSGLYLGTIAVLALGIGAIVRDLAGSILAVVGFLWVMPFVATMIPVPEVRELAVYLPTSAGVLLLAPDGAATELTPWGGYVVLLAWTAATLAAAVITLRARDV
jgi:ABC-2 type transport system permease protein